MSLRPPINFLVIGAQKSGTSWLSEMLAEHPEVFRSAKKELHYFDRRANFNRGPQWYLEHFKGVNGEIAIGECTPNYLWVCDAPDELHDDRQRKGKRQLDFTVYGHLIRNIHVRVHELLPDIKIIVSLRDPVDRAISSFFHAIRARRLSPSANILDVGGQYGILGIGFYYRQLKEWMSLFPRERFLFLIYEEDILQNKDRTLATVYRHLGVSDFVPSGTERRFNSSANGLYMRANYYAPRLAPAVFRKFSALNKLNLFDIKVSAEDRAELADIYRAENRRLEELLGRSLACWA